MKRFLVIDAYPLVYRAHFGFSKNPLTRWDGTIISGLYGYANHVISAIKGFKPTHVAAALDFGDREHKKLLGRTWRHDLFEQYKVQRKTVPEELVSQLKQIEELNSSLMFPSFKAQGFEGDDILNSLCQLWLERTATEKTEVFLLSTDKDIHSLVSSNVTVIRPVPNATQHVYRYVRPEDVKEIHGVEPSQIVDYLALAGDAADGVPGAEGIGSKMASKLLEEYGSIDNLLERCQQQTFPFRLDPGHKAKKGDPKPPIPLKRMKWLCDDLLKGHIDSKVLLSRRLVELQRVPGLEPPLNALEFPGFSACLENNSTFKKFSFPNLSKRLKDITEEWETSNSNSH